MSDIKTLKVYQVPPAHAQVGLDPSFQVVVDLLNEEGEVVGTNVYDRVDLDTLASGWKAKLVWVKNGAEPEEPTADDDEPSSEGLEALTLDELYEIAKKLKIKGRTKLDKAGLIAAIEDAS